MTQRSVVASLKMPFLLPLLALLLLSAAPTVTEVVTSISDCDENFLDRTPPQIGGILERGNIRDQNRYKLICQTLKNLRTFVTLYDTTNKIPVFSAYKYTGKKDIRRPHTPWKIEPQVCFLTEKKFLLSVILYLWVILQTHITSTCFRTNSCLQMKPSLL